MQKLIALLISTVLTGCMAMPGYAEDAEIPSGQFGSKYDASAKGYWSDEHNLTWTWYGKSECVIIGNGPKYSDLYPEVTDREALLKDYVNYPGKGLTNFNHRGEPKANVDEEVPLTRRWEEQYWNGEITYEVLQEKVAELYR